MSARLRVIVVAPTYPVAEHWARSLDMPPGMWAYAGRSSRLMGVSGVAIQEITHPGAVWPGGYPAIRDVITCWLGVHRCHRWDDNDLRDYLAEAVEGGRMTINRARVIAGLPPLAVKDYLT